MCGQEFKGPGGKATQVIYGAFNPQWTCPDCQATTSCEPLTIRRRKRSLLTVNAQIILKGNAESISMVQYLEPESWPGNAGMQTDGRPTYPKDVNLLLHHFTEIMTHRETCTFSSKYECSCSSVSISLPTNHELKLQIHQIIELRAKKGKWRCKHVHVIWSHIATENVLSMSQICVRRSKPADTIRGIIRHQLCSSATNPQNSHLKRSPKE